MKKAIVLAIVLLSACKQGAWVSVDGSRLTESDVEKEMPDQYKRLKEEYNSQMRDLLEQVAVKKMMQKAAKEKGVDEETYARQISEKAPEPTEKQIADFYEQIKKTGQTDGQSLAQLHSRIAMHLKQEGGREAMQNEISELKKKYNYTYDFSRTKVETAGNPERGNASAKVTVVEFSDFECPYCIRVQPTLQKLREKYNGKIRWVFKDFPLNFHPHAMDMHIGSKCVYRVNKDHYWEFFDKMFAQDRSADILTKEGTAKLAASLGTDMNKYKACTEDPAVAAEIKDSIKQGEAVGVSGTPAFFINGRMLSGAQPMSAFEEVIQQEL